MKNCLEKLIEPGKLKRIIYVYLLLASKNHFSAGVCSQMIDIIGYM